MRRRRKNLKRERTIMLCSSVLVLSALTMTGLYVKEKKEIQDDGYVVDLSQLEPETMEEPVEETVPIVDTESVSSTKIENRDSLQEQDSLYSFMENTEFSDEEYVDEEFQLFAEEEGFLFQEEELSFGEEDKLLWPVVGNVLIDYSMEAPVYFATLEQYKCNPAIIIQSNRGQNITAAAKGKIMKIEKTEELGNVITMDVGSGYEVSYGQVENIQVKEGDMVEKGAYLGDVAPTTKYFIVEGDNVYFSLKKDGKPVNPLTKLQ